MARNSLRAHLLAAVVAAYTINLCAPNVAYAASNQNGQAPLSALNFLAGSCWQGPAPHGKSTDTHCYSKQLNGNILADSHIVPGENGDYCGLTIYHWDAMSKSILYRYWASDGGVSNGSVNSPKHGTLVYPDETYADLAGNVLKFRTTWELTDGDQLKTRLEQYSKGEWREAATGNFRRVASQEAADDLRRSIDSCLAKS